VRGGLIDVDTSSVMPSVTRVFPSWGAKNLQRSLERVSRYADRSPGRLRHALTSLLAYTASRASRSTLATWSGPMGRSAR
jgi:hypothetical protein